MRPIWKPTLPLAVLGIWLAAAAAPPLAGQSAEAGPALGVARVSLINGDVTLRRSDSGDRVAAQVNTPLVEGDALITGPSSRAEIQLDHANMIRLDADAEVEIAELGNRRFRVRLVRGRATYSELRKGEADVDIETPHAAVRPLKQGRYEIGVAPGETIVIVRKGEAEVASTQGVETIKKGRMMVVREGDQGPEFRVDKAEERDEWDRWNERRDDRLAKVNSYRYVSSSVSGAADLDDHGDWRYISGYGYTWYPRVGYGWAPYRHGRWSWIDYYGWTWVGYEPWGWAPYHYGRWFHRAGYGWGWYPGPRHHRHYWRPALVGFFGYNSHSGFSLGVGLGFGSIGWTALAPGERYYPWYGGRYYHGGHGGHGGINNTTIIVDNSVNITNVFRNARAHNGVSVVDARGFSRGLASNPRSLRGVELRRASLIRGQIPIVPARESQGANLRASDGGRRSSGRTFFSRGSANPTPRMNRVPFNRQRDQVAASVRSFVSNRGTGSASSSSGRRGPSSVRKAGVATAPVRSRQSSSGRRGSRAAPSAARGVRAAAPTSSRGQVRTAAPPPSAARTAADRGGFRRFGGSRNSSTNRPRSSSIRSAAPSRAPTRSRTRVRSSGSGSNQGFRVFSGGRSGGDRTVRASSASLSRRPSAAAPVRSRSQSSGRSGVRSRPSGGSASRGATRVGSIRSTSAPTRSRSAGRPSGGFIPRTSSRRSSSTPSVRGGGSATLGGRGGSSRVFVPSTRTRAPSPSVSRGVSRSSRSARPSPVRSRSGGFGGGRASVTSRSSVSRPSGGSRPRVSRGGSSRRPSGGGGRSARAPTRSRGGGVRGRG